jgi:ABC-type antimicrobial peptide transport system permease subunit
MLAMIGVYGLAAIEVTRHRRDCSLRAALGATRREILWSVMRPIGWTMFIALVAGVIAGVGAATAMRSLLSGVGPLDPVTLLSLPVLIAAIGVLAALLAARPILREDPAATLRT